MAEGFGRWEADPLFPAAECVQDSADRMEGVYRLLLHERKLIQDDTSHTKRRVSMQYERDVCTALGTTKWQLEQFEREVNAAALSNKSNSRENAILQFRQFIRAIAEQISQVEDSLESLRNDSIRTPKHSYLTEHDGDELASFLSVNGYHSTQERTSCEFRYSGEDVEGAAKPQCSCGENACEGDHNGSSMRGLDSDDSIGRKHHFRSKLSRKYHSFMRNLWFTNRGRESFTKRRKDGEVMDSLRNGSTLPSFNLPPAGRAMYFWPELIKRRLSKFKCSTHHKHLQVRLATVLLIALAVLGLLVLHVR
ncbi:hypothetical protein DAI22_05g178100 [Oryza sativa Japonica Group]|nr:hypothetical protein DAI22_05g178100 [Oryza sativa Japonica Group]